MILFIVFPATKFLALINVALYKADPLVAYLPGRCWPLDGKA
jgi:hypothetical protein